jgi:hypothetical protein
MRTIINSLVLVPQNCKMLMMYTKITNLIWFVVHIMLTRQMTMVLTFLTLSWIKAEEHNEMVITRTATITRQSDFLDDFELMIYHTAQRVMPKSSCTVGIFHYEPGRPGLISHTYGPNIPESIVDYSDVLQFKFKQAGVHDTIRSKS